MYTIKRLPQFKEWIDNLNDAQTRIRLNKRLDKVQRGLLGDVAPVGEGVFEMREFFGAGWRMYYVQRGETLIVMIGGGDKSTQSADIATAIYLKQFEGITPCQQKSTSPICPILIWLKSLKATRILPFI